jgi:hypothetical protein
VQCHVQDREKEGCRLWPRGHVFYREPGWSSPMYTVHIIQVSKSSKVWCSWGEGKGEGEGGGGGREGVFNEDFAAAIF